MPTAATKTRAHYHHLGTTLRSLEADLRWGMEGSERIPTEWHAIAQADTPPLKKQVTLRLDGDVVAFFRSMGAGHLTRMNAVLRAFMHGRLAGVVKGAEAVGYQPSPMEAYIAEAAAVLAMIERHNAMGRLGRDTVAEDMAVERRLNALKRMEEDMDLPKDLRVTERSKG